MSILKTSIDSASGSLTSAGTETNSEYVRIPRSVYESLVKQNRNAKEQEKSLHDRYYTLKKKYLVLRTEKKKDELKLKQLTKATMSRNEQSIIYKSFGTVARTLGFTNK